VEAILIYPYILSLVLYILVSLLVAQELQAKHQALEAFRETVAVFNEHILMCENCQKRAPPHELLR